MRSGNDLTVISGDARVSCHRLQEFLGYKAVRHIHDMIRKHRDELEDFGEVFARESKNPSPKGGRPTTFKLGNVDRYFMVFFWFKATEKWMYSVPWGHCQKGCVNPSSVFWGGLPERKFLITFDNLNIFS